MLVLFNSCLRDAHLEVIAASCVSSGDGGIRKIRKCDASRSENRPSGDDRGPDMNQPIADGGCDEQKFRANLNEGTPATKT